MKTIVFRTLGGHGIGYGHFFRSVSLAKAFLNYDNKLNVVFIINSQLMDQLIYSEIDYIISNSFENDIEIIETLNPQLFILDTYLAKNDYLIKVKKISKLMIFDDNNDLYDSTIPDIVLNGNIHAGELQYKTNNNSLYLLGPKYLVMKEEYWKRSKYENEKYEHKNGILITTGGTDPFNISFHILNSIRQLPYMKRIVIGPGYEQDLIYNLEQIKDEKTELIHKPVSLCDYIRESIVVITAGGSTIYEVLSQRTMPIIFSIADNQDIACKYFLTLGISYIGKHPQIEYNDLNKEIIHLMDQPNCYNDAIFDLVDGRGAKRVIEVIHPLIVKSNS
ncbi:PseG/SpsG family protein [Paenibacillus cremeus]|uniref:Glycosyl transferase family 28 C-terminal domain-containing protein n=1 Tax=Paenibacillus cremeus TaxID=2163881 RepID=A0A559K4Z0_9BACL|nr:hypothetical protein [Paenibacillus cremeus]TVY07205.1 hypothetical protein FPZ49_25205 [Paenibacillus cremeus]